MTAQNKAQPHPDHPLHRYRHRHSRGQQGRQLGDRPALQRSLRNAGRVRSRLTAWLPARLKAPYNLPFYASGRRPHIASQNRGRFLFEGPRLENIRRTAATTAIV